VQAETKIEKSKGGKNTKGGGGKNPKEGQNGDSPTKIFCLLLFHDFFSICSGKRSLMMN